MKNKKKKPSQKFPFVRRIYPHSISNSIPKPPIRDKDAYRKEVELCKINLHLPKEGGVKKKLYRAHEFHLFYRRVTAYINIADILWARKNTSLFFILFIQIRFWNVRPSRLRVLCSSKYSPRLCVYLLWKKEKSGFSETRKLWQILYNIGNMLSLYLYAKKFTDSCLLQFPSNKSALLKGGQN